MTFPIINNIYIYNDKHYIVWAQSMFRTVYCRELVNTGGSVYISISWFKFIFKAKKIGIINNDKSVY